MSEELRAWLAQELNRRKWSQRELARQAEVSQTFISQVLSGDAPPSVNFCHKIAQALNTPPETVLRLAGILPAPTSEDSTLQELIDLARSLPPAERQQALDFIRFLLRKG